jgi:hypothetical protein
VGRSGDFNDSSYVILWWTRAGRVLFCGAPHDDTWEHILDYGAWVANVDIMIAPHHGRDSGRERKFLNTVRPKLTLFGRAPSEHLMYGALRSRELPLITATPGGHGCGGRIRYIDAHLGRQRGMCPQAFPGTWYDPYGGWYWGSPSVRGVWRPDDALSSLSTVPSIWLAPPSLHEIARVPRNRKRTWPQRRSRSQGADAERPAGVSASGPRRRGPSGHQEGPQGGPRPESGGFRRASDPGPVLSPRASPRHALVSFPGRSTGAIMARNPGFFLA